MAVAHSLYERLRAYLRYRETVFQLSHLSDHDLKDLGLNRSDIKMAARG